MDYNQNDMNQNGMNGGYPQQGQPDAGQPYGGAPQQPYGTPQQPYGGDPYGTAPQDKKGFAIASMVCGIVSIVTCCCEYIAIPLSIVAIVLGIISIKKQESGKGMAIAGIACGGAALAFIIVSLILYATGAVDTTQWEEMLKKMQEQQV